MSKNKREQVSWCRPGEPIFVDKPTRKFIEYTEEGNYYLLYEFMKALVDIMVPFEYNETKDVMMVRLPNKHDKRILLCISEGKIKKHIEGYSTRKVK